MALSSDLLLNVPDFGEGVIHRHPMHTPVIELFLYILLSYSMSLEVTILKSISLFSSSCFLKVDFYDFSISENFSRSLKFRMCFAYFLASLSGLIFFF